LDLLKDIQPRGRWWGFNKSTIDNFDLAD
jgi:hypothetical protein